MVILAFALGLGAAAAWVAYGPGRLATSVPHVVAGWSMVGFGLVAGWQVGWSRFGPLLVVGFFDVRELVMLGDTGSNLIGALAGLWLVLALGTTGQVVALIVLALITAYGEFRSISDLVDRTPGLSHLDSIGRIQP